VVPGDALLEYQKNQKAEKVFIKVKYEFKIKNARV